MNQAQVYVGPYLAVPHQSTGSPLRPSAVPGVRDEVLCLFEHRENGFGFWVPNSGACGLSFNPAYADTRECQIDSAEIEEELCRYRAEFSQEIDAVTKHLGKEPEIRYGMLFGREC